VADKKAIQKSRERTAGLAVDAAAEGLSVILPGSGPVAKWLYRVFADGRRRRLDDLSRRLLTGAQALPEKEFRKALEDEPLCHEIVLQLLEDEEGEKAWAYAALFRSFATNLVRAPERIRYLRCLRELTLEELKDMPRWYRQTPAGVVGPYAHFRIIFERGHREWFVQPELKQEESPHLFESLTRWGFIKRVHDRAEQGHVRPRGEKAYPTPPAFLSRREQIPVPGRTRLEVAPELALLFFVLTERPREGAPELGKPIGLQVETRGSIEDPGTHSLASKPFPSA